MSVKIVKVVRDKKASEVQLDLNIDGVLKSFIVSADSVTPDNIRETVLDLANRYRKELTQVSNIYPFLNVDLENM